MDLIFNLFKGIFKMGSLVCKKSVQKELEKQRLEETKEDK